MNNPPKPEKDSSKVYIGGVFFIKSLHYIVEGHAVGKYMEARKISPSQHQPPEAMASPRPRPSLGISRAGEVESEMSGLDRS